MATFKKGNRQYIDYYLPNGNRKREVVKIKGVDPERITRQDALKALAIRKGQLAEGKFDIADTKKPVLFEKLAEDYLKYSEDNKRAWQRDLYSIRQLLPYFKGKTLNQITSWLVEKYKSDRKDQVKPSTVNRELDTLRNMLNKAVDWKMIDSSPYKGVKHFRVNNTNLRILNQSEFEKLYQASPSDLKPILVTAVNTGMRLSEVLNLKWNDVDLDKGYLIVRDSKNYESRTISLNPNLKAALSSLKKETQSEYVFNGRKTIKRAWTNTLRKSGIPHCRFHDLRHTFASNLVMNGYDLVTVAELMGHKDISMTKRYSHPTPQHKKQAVESLNFGAVDTYLDTKEDSEQVEAEIESNVTILKQTTI
jgi:integrase